MSYQTDQRGGEYETKHKPSDIAVLIVLGELKEVTLCPSVTCALWQFLFGYTIWDQKFKKRIETANKKYSREFREVSNMILDDLKNMPRNRENEHIRIIYEEALTMKG